MVFKSLHECPLKEEGYAVSGYLPRAFYLLGIGTNLEAIQFLYFLGAIKALTAQLLTSKNKMPTVDV